MLSFAFIYYYTERHYAECRYAECHGANHKASYENLKTILKTGVL
jgi:hypothetical protein